MEKIDLRGQPLDLDIMFTCGQAFRWRKRNNGIWQGVVRDKLLELKAEDGQLLWRTYPQGGKSLVEDYLRLNDDVNTIYSALAKCDSHMAELTEKFAGLRFLRQDPMETLLSFICSAANSIPRIMRAIELLSVQFGNLICEKENSCYYAFPSVQSLANADRTTLERTAGLAFRGANMKLVAQQILDKGEDWLLSLRDVDYYSAKNALLEIRGVGAKIADCVCLFSLDKDESVPVDTHVRQVAQRFFMPELKAKSVTDAVYRRVVAAFQERYGQYAGWAQQFLFYEDLLRTRELGRGLR